MDLQAFPYGFTSLPLRAYKPFPMDFQIVPYGVHLFIDFFMFGKCRSRRETPCYFHDFAHQVTSEQTLECEDPLKSQKDLLDDAVPLGATVEHPFRLSVLGLLAVHPKWIWVALRASRDRACA